MMIEVSSKLLRSSVSRSPFQKFKGSTEAEQRKAAYEAILGPGACNVRGIMKRANCRLQLRGLGCPGSMLLSAEAR